MADKKTSDETAADAFDGSELFRLVQGGASKKGTAAQMKAYAVTSAAILDALGYAPTRIYKKRITFDTPGLVAGIPIYTPAVGELLLDAWPLIIEAFDGTTPKADIGTFVGIGEGILGFWSGGIWALHNASPEGESGIGAMVRSVGGEGSGFGNSSLAFAQNSSNQQNAPAAFTATSPLKLCISTTGATAGDPIGGTTGILDIYFVIGTAIDLDA